MRTIGTVVRGVRAPIIREGDNIAEVAAASVMEAWKEAGIEPRDRDVVAVTESVVARSQGNYASVQDMAADVRAKLGGETVGVIFPILSRNRFAICLRGVALGAKKVVLMLSYPSDEVGNCLVSLDKLDEARPISSIHDIPAIGRFIFTLDSYIGMYQNHKDLLQYNDNFNNYITHLTVRQEELANFHASLNSVNTRLHMMYAKAKEDKTFRTDIPEEQFMRVTVQTMMAACTHYAGGFIWGATDNKDYTGDLLLLKEMILNYARNDANL